MDPKKRSELEKLCQKHQVDFSSLPHEFLDEIGRNFTPQTQAPEITNRDLRSLVEVHGIDPNENPEFYRKLDSNMNQTQKAMEDMGRLFSKKLNQTRFDPLMDIYRKEELGPILFPHIALSQKKGHKLSVIMLDLDKFKDYNDTYKHIQGDYLLKTVGKVLNGLVKSPNSVIRYGGEEIFIVMPETDEQEAFNLAERIRSTIEHTVVQKDPDLEKKGYPFPDDGYKHITATLGVFTYHPGLDAVLGFYEHENDGEYMVKQVVHYADIACVEAKEKNQRNQVHVTKLD